MPRFISILLILACIIYSSTTPGLTKISKTQQLSQQTTQESAGTQTVFLLQLLYESDSRQCGQQPGYYCSGFLLSAFEDFDGYWFHPVNNNRLSFTYMQPPIATRPFGPAGFILWPQEMIDEMRANTSPNVFSPRFHCGFPIDGMTYSRPDSGCGATPNIPDSAPCQNIGVNDAQTWLLRYSGKSSEEICGFLLDGDTAANTNAFNAITSVIMASNIRNTAAYPWNEIAIESWPSNSPDRVPVMALFYMPDFEYSSKKPNIPTKRKTLDIRDASGALATAQQQQQLYYAETNIFVPIIKISGNFPAVTFSFSQNDQAPGIPDDVKIYPN